jgi:hypothetical protein
VGYIVPLGGWDYLGDFERQGALEVRPFERVVRLFMTEVTLNRTLGNLYDFMKPTHRFKDLLTMKWLQSVVFYFIVIIFR